MLILDEGSHLAVGEYFKYMINLRFDQKNALRGKGCSVALLTIYYVGGVVVPNYISKLMAYSAFIETVFVS